MQIAAYDVARANAPYRDACHAALAMALDGASLILGDGVSAFEAAFAGFCGVEECIGVGNGLDALTLALRAAGVGRGDEVIVPAFTFVATWFSVVHAGARPVPVDVRPDGTIDPALIPAAIGPRTRAIVPVHLFGALADMDPILGLADHHGLDVIEDAAQAHGAEIGGRRAGAFGRAAAFSFYPTKNLGALGDGGAVCTDDAGLAERVRRLRNYGSDRKYHHATIGWNSRLDEMQAAFLSAKLAGMPEANARRRHLAERYFEALEPAALPGIELPWRSRSSVWHQFVIRCRERDRVRAALSERGVGTLVHYPVAPFDQPCFAGQYERARYPVALQLSNTVLSLPMADYLTPAEFQHVTTAVIGVARSLGPA